MDHHATYSAVKIDVSSVTSQQDAKVLVLSHESSTRDVVTSLLRKLKMRHADPHAFAIEAEIEADQDLAILQFEEEDKLMQAYHQFPKGSMRLCLRYKTDMDIADEKRGKTGVNGHQLTLQRIRRSLEKLKRKSGHSTSQVPASTSQVPASTSQVPASTSHIPASTSHKPASTSHVPASTARSRTQSGTHSSYTDTHGQNSTQNTHSGSQSARTEKRTSSNKSLEHSSSIRNSRPPIKPTSTASPTRIKSQGVSASTSRGHRSPMTSSDKVMTSSQQNGGVISDRRREYRNRNERSRRRSHGGEEHNGYKSPFGLNKNLSYKTTIPHGGGSGAVSDTDCMIVYDGASEHNVSNLPIASQSTHALNSQSTHALNSQSAHGLHGSQSAHALHANSTYALHSRSHVMPVKHMDTQQGAKQNMMIDKPAKMATRNLEDSGIDVKSPPVLSAHKMRDRVHSMNDMDYARSHHHHSHHRKHTPNDPTTTTTQPHDTYLSPTLSNSSPLSLTSANHVTRTGSFSSLKSLPVTVFKEPGESPCMFEPIGQDRLRSKSQSMSNLHNNKVVRRRSLPPLDVSQERLEQKKSSLSKRLAKKISNFRNNEKRYMLPSPHTFTSPNHRSPNSRQNSGGSVRDVSDNRRHSKHDLEQEDDADMEVACILEGKPEHPTDSDVEDYLACVESTNTTQSEQQHTEPTESTPYSHLDQQEHSKHSHSNNAGENIANFTHIDHNNTVHHSQTREPKFNSYVNLPSPVAKQPNVASMESRMSHDSRQHNNISSPRQHKYAIPDQYSYDDTNNNNTHHSKPESRDLSHADNKTPDNIQSTQQNQGEKGAIPKKKHINKFVEQSMKSFMKDGPAKSESDILQMHHAALQGQISSPDPHHRPQLQSTPAKHELQSNPSTEALVHGIPSPFKDNYVTGLSQESESEVFDPEPKSHPDSSSANQEQELTEYEKVRRKFAHMSTNGSLRSKQGHYNSVNPKPNHANTDTTFKSNIQLTLVPKTKSTSDVTTNENARIPHRSNSQSHDADKRLKPQNNHVTDISISDEEWASKALTLFQIIKTHSIISVFLEKNGHKSFGIKVKRVLFSSSGLIKDTSEFNNVVAVHEFVENAPAATSGQLVPYDVIIEVNGHNVLQSSDKVVRTLLDARSALEMVIARHKHTRDTPTHQPQHATDTRQIPPQLSHNIVMNNTDNNMNFENGDAALVFHNMNDIEEDCLKPEGCEGHVGSRSQSYESRSRLYEQTEGQGDSPKAYTSTSHYDTFVRKQQLKQLSEGPTFLL